MKELRLHVFTVTCQTTVNVIAKWIFIFTIVLSDTGLQMWTEDN